LAEWLSFSQAGFTQPAHRELQPLRLLLVSQSQDIAKKESLLRMGLSPLEEWPVQSLAF
jgi:hypothetical protein